MNYKEYLLKTHMFEDNEYLEMYVQLINNNLNTKKEIFVTQRHHIIPVHYFKDLNIEPDDNDYNLINLKYSDHALAHYYMFNASNNHRFKMLESRAFEYLTNLKIKKYEPSDKYNAFMDSLNNLDDIYRLSKELSAELSKIKHGPCSKETRDKISKKNKGRVYVNKDNVVRSIYPDKLEEYINDGWVKGNIHNQINRKKHSGYHVINDGYIHKFVYDDELDYYLKTGWTEGRTKESSEKISKTIRKQRLEMSSEERKAIYGKGGIKTKGRKHSKDWCEKISRSNKGKIASKEQRIKNSLLKKDTVHLTNGVINKMVKPEFAEYWLERGFWRGRTMKRKNKNIEIEREREN